MKTKLGVLIFLMAAVFARASTLRSSTATEDGQTNNLTALLQKGLFEEQANRNLNAAIADYQSLAAKFDQYRKLAATAIFRLGECYRMQGKTNEAAAQYQRILREFPDEKTLATLSRQNLAGMGIQAKAAFSAARQRQIELLEKQIALAQTNLATLQERFRLGKATQAEVTAAEQQAVQLQITLAGLNANSVETLNSPLPAETRASEKKAADLWNRVKNLPEDQLEKVLPTLAPDPVLTSLLQQRNEAETKLAEATNYFAPQTPNVVSQKAVLGAINKQISEKINGIMAALKLRAELTQQPLAPQRIFYVGGEVKMPGRFAYVDKTTVTKAIQTAGDFTDFANRTKVKLIRNNGQVIIVNCIKALETPSLDPPVHPGDQIQVPRRIF